MTDTPKWKPPFGAHRLQPDGLRAVYGGRWIVTQDGYVDIVWDRHSIEGADKNPLMEWLNGMALGAAREKASDFLKRRLLKTRERSPVILYCDDRGAIVADTNASGGYLYVTGWLFDDLSDGNSRGLDKVAAAITEARGDG